MFLGIDTGGTFTDFVYFDGKRIRFHKVLSTPDDPSQAIMEGIQRLNIDPALIDLVHGSTVATNAILERKGVKTLFITNHGLEDILLIGRQTRDKLYELCPEPPTPWLEREDCLGITGRVDAKGEVIEECNPNELHKLGQKSKAYDAVACCTLFSFLNPYHEREIASAIPSEKFISLSHEILPEYREYERAATTFLNAYVGPLAERYLQRLNTRLGARHLFIMHSAGGMMDIAQAGRQAVRMILSGPAGGIVATRMIGEQLQEERLISFDMGGTSTDVALIDGKASITIEGSIAGLPVAIPMLDIHTIGAGGGSIAWFDEAGILHVGPESAGAAPGPVCYGLGGRKITVTDANLILGRIPASVHMAGSIPLNLEGAYAAMTALASDTGLTPEALADGIVKIAEENMAGALRVVSIQRGYDPRRFSLVCFGGAGGLHACSLAEMLGIREVIVPLASGAFSALGMLTSHRQSDFSRSQRLSLDSGEAMNVARNIFADLKDQARISMPNLDLVFECFVDLRYVGQGFHLTLPFVADLDALVKAFVQEHARAYGHVLEDHGVEIITLRLRASAPTRPMSWPQLPRAEQDPQSTGLSDVWHVGKVMHYPRKGLLAGHELPGPALILEDTATLWLPPQWHCTVSSYGHLLLKREDHP